MNSLRLAHTSAHHIDGKRSPEENDVSDGCLRIQPRANETDAFFPSLKSIGSVRVDASDGSSLRRTIAS